MDAVSGGPAGLELSGQNTFVGRYGTNNCTNGSLLEISQATAASGARDSEVTDGRRDLRVVGEVAYRSGRATEICNEVCRLGREFRRPPALCAASEDCALRPMAYRRYVDASSAIDLNGRLETAFEELAAAPWEPERWPTAVQAVAEASGGWCGHLIGAASDRSYLFGVEGRLPQGVFEAWARLGGPEAANNPRAAAIFRTPDLVVIGDDDFVDGRGRARNAIYQDVYRPYDVGQSLIVRSPLPDGGSAIMTCMRPEAAGAPEQEHRDALRRLAPALAAAVRLQAMVEVRSTGLAFGILQHMDVPAFFLDGQGRVTELSARAAQMVGDADVLKLQRGRLKAVTQGDDCRLQGAIDRLARVRFGASEFLMRGAQDADPVRVTVSHLPTTAPFGLATLVVTLSFPKGISPTLLAELGLTASEGAVAVALAAGERPQEIAASRRVSLPTVRSQVREIYTKLRVLNVGQLARRLNRLR